MAVRGEGWRLDFFLLCSLLRGSRQETWENNERHLHSSQRSLPCRLHPVEDGYVRVHTWVRVSVGEGVWVRVSMGEARAGG